MVAFDLDRSLVADAGFPDPFVDPCREVALLLLGASFGEVLSVRFGNEVPDTVVRFDIIAVIQVEFRVNPVNPLVDEIVLLVSFSVKSYCPVAVCTLGSRHSTLN